MPFAATWMHLESVIFSERQVSYDIAYTESKRLIQMNLFTKQNSLTDVENKTKGEKRRGINCEIGMNIYIVLYIKCA